MTLDDLDLSSRAPGRGVRGGQTDARAARAVAGDASERRARLSPDTPRAGHCAADAHPVRLLIMLVKARHRLKNPQCEASDRRSGTSWPWRAGRAGWSSSLSSKLEARPRPAQCREGSAAGRANRPLGAPWGWPSSIRHLPTHGCRISEPSGVRLCALSVSEASTRSLETGMRQTDSAFCSRH